MTRKPPSKLSRLDQLVKSHKHLLRAFRSLVQSNGELRKVILAKPVYDYDWYRGYRDGLTKNAKNTLRNSEFDVPPNDWPRL